MSLPMTYIYLSDLIRMDGPCLKPTDKDKAGRLCGKRAVTGGLTAGSDKAKRAAAKFRAEKYGKKGQSPQQQGINKIPVKPSPGGALVQKGGALAVKEKAAEQGAEQPKNKSRQRKIDEKYAKPNPTDKDVDDWLNESAKEFAKPDRSKVESDYVAQRKKELMREVAYGDTEENRKAVEAIKTKKDVANVIYEQRQKKIKERGEWTPYSLGIDLEAPSEDQIAELEKKSTSARTQKSRDKAKRDYDEAVKKRAEVLPKYEKRAKELNDKYKSPKEDQVAELMGAFDEKINKTFAEKEKVYKDFQKGQKRAINKVKEDLVSSLPSWGETVQGYGSYEAFASQEMDNVRREAVKTHLQNTYNESKSPFGKLGDQPTEGDLKKAYRAAAVKVHPDKGGSKEEFQALNEQYEQMRQKYGFDSLVRGDAFNWVPWEEINRYCDTYIRLF